jgi:hypothetical protein
MKPARSITTLQKPLRETLSLLAEFAPTMAA